MKNAKFLELLTELRLIYPAAKTVEQLDTEIINYPSCVEINGREEIEGFQEIYQPFWNEFMEDDYKYYYWGTTNKIINNEWNVRPYSMSLDYLLTPSPLLDLDIRNFMDRTVMSTATYQFTKIEYKTLKNIIKWFIIKYDGDKDYSLLTYKIQVNNNQLEKEFWFQFIHLSLRNDVYGKALTSYKDRTEL
ncbi:MAG: hypothetical protein ACRCXT_17555 [Paraclostridium sp.]